MTILKSSFNNFINFLKSKYIILFIFLLCSSIYYVWTWSPILAETGGDNATYLLTANLYSPYSSSSFISKFFAYESQYPPLYPLLLGVLGGGESILVAHFITTTFLLLAAVVLFNWCISLKLDYYLATIIVLIFLILPSTYIHSLSIHSENLYLLLSLLGIYSVTKHNKNSKWIWAAAIFIACSALTRSAGIALAISFIIYLFINKERNKKILSIVVLMPMMIWEYINKNKDGTYFSDIYYYYSEGFVLKLTQQVAEQLPHLFNAWHVSYTSAINAKLFLIVLAILCLLGSLYRLSRWKLDGIYIYIYLLMILIWPYPAELKRLLLPIIPIALVQLSMLVMKLTSSRESVKEQFIGNVFLPTLIFIMVLPNLLLTINRYNIDLPEDLIVYRHTYDWYHPDLATAYEKIIFNHKLIVGIEDSKKIVPVDECVYSIKPSLIGFYMGRKSLMHPDTSIKNDNFIKIIKDSSCEYFYFVNNTTPSYKIPFYPYHRLSNSIDIIKIYYSDKDNKNAVSMLGKIKLSEI